MKLVIVIPLSFLFLHSFIVLIQCAKRKRLLGDESESQTRTVWDDENKRKLLKIFYETNTGERGHRKRLKDKWDQLHVMEKNHSAYNLYNQATRWIANGDADRLLTGEDKQCKEYEPQKNMIWTLKMRNDLLRFYYESHPSKLNQSRRLKELWDREYPTYFDISAHRLMLQVRQILLERGEATNPKTVFWTRKEKEDLLRCYYMAQKNRGVSLQVMRDLFIKKHPRFVYASTKLLHNRMSNFRQKHPGINEKILREVSASNTIHHSPAKALELKREEETKFMPKYGSDNPLKVSEQYFDPKRDNAWIDNMIEETSFPYLHSFPDTVMNHQDIYHDYPGDHPVFPEVGTSHQNIHSGYLEDTLRKKSG